MGAFSAIMQWALLTLDGPFLVVYGPFVPCHVCRGTTSSPETECRVESPIDGLRFGIACELCHPNVCKVRLKPVKNFHALRSPHETMAYRTAPAYYSSYTLLQHLGTPWVNRRFEHLLKPRSLHIQFQGCSLIARLAPTSTHRGATVHFTP